MTIGLQALIQLNAVESILDVVGMENGVARGSTQDGVSVCDLAKKR